MVNLLNEEMMQYHQSEKRRSWVEKASARATVKAQKILTDAEL